MTTGLSEPIAHQILDAMCNNVPFAIPQIFAKLHVGDPGAAGTANPATETARKAVSWGTPSAGGVVSDADVEWTNIAGPTSPTTEDMTHYSLWTASSGGTFVQSGTVTGNPVSAGDTVRIPAGTIALDFASLAA